MWAQSGHSPRGTHERSFILFVPICRLGVVAFCSNGFLTQTDEYEAATKTRAPTCFLLTHNRAEITPNSPVWDLIHVRTKRLLCHRHKYTQTLPASSVVACTFSSTFMALCVFLVWASPDTKIMHGIHSRPFESKESGNICTHCMYVIYTCVRVIFVCIYVCWCIGI